MNKQKTYSIAVVGGDGTGPEVVEQGLKALDAIQSLYPFKLKFKPLELTGERYLKTGRVLDDDDKSFLNDCDAIYLGAIGHPDIKPGILERGILLKLRFDYDQYINLRPVKLYPNVYSPIKNVEPDDIDYVVVRENTGGLYSGVGGHSMANSKYETAQQSMVYSYHQVERCLRYAFETVLKRHQTDSWKGLSEAEKAKGYVGKLTLCGKSNVLTYVFDLWLRVLDDLKKEFPTVLVDYVHVDAVCIYMIESPQRFDVIVTTNMFGDIITDLAATTQGGMGVAASANINPNGLSMFEPIGGTAPSFTGLDQINPMAAIAAAHMMLDHLGEFDAAHHLEQAKLKTIETMDSMAAAKMGCGTKELGNRVVDFIKQGSSY